MEWHYTLNGQRHGPVAGEELEELSRRGVIDGRTMIWREGMEQWQPLSVAKPVAPRASPHAPAAVVDRAVCSECGLRFPESELVHLEEYIVCGGCKPLLLQRLREGVGPKMGQIWRSCDLLVMRSKTLLPDRCVRCNADAKGYRLNLRLAWYPPAIHWFWLLSPLGFIIAAMFKQRDAHFDVGLCDRHRAQRNGWGAACFGCIILGIVLVAVTKAGSSYLIAAGFALFLSAIIVSEIKTKVLKPTKITKEFAWVKGAGEKFMADFPDWPGPD